MRGEGAYRFLLKAVYRASLKLFADDRVLCGLTGLRKLSIFYYHETFL